MPAVLPLVLPCCVLVLPLPLQWLKVCVVVLSAVRFRYAAPRGLSCTVISCVYCLVRTS